MKACLAGVLTTFMAVTVMATPLARINFDEGWRFARFGRLPDGSVRDEPGAEWQAARASSEELDRGNVAAHAMDGDPATRWCAAGPSRREWWQMDLGRPVALQAIELQWEKPADYAPRIEVSEAGVNWELAATPDQPPDAAGHQKVDLATTARFVRVKPTRTSSSRWASLAEVRLLGADGRIVKPRRPRAPGQSPSAPAFDDSGWRTLDLPHDWGIEGPFDIDLEGSTGKLPWTGIGWYRKSFTLPADDAGQRIFLDVDGAMMDAKVWLNGEYVGRWPYGYSSFRLDLTQFARPGGENLLAVRLENLPNSSRWYPGAGLYRDVWLVKTPPVHLAHNGVFVTTPDVRADRARVRVQVEVVNHTARPGNVGLGLQVTAPDGRTLRPKGARLSVPPAGRTKTALEFDLPQPALWSLTDPKLYQLEVTLSPAGTGNAAAAEVERIFFGVRTIAFDPQKGFLLNGRPTPLHGVCNHHDLGALGAAWNRRAAERQIQILQAMGCNSIRTSHNPPAPGLVELCDRMGMTLMVEAFDCWDRGKRPNDYGRFFNKWHEKDLRLMTRNFRNHPSVVMWSIGNEIPGGYQSSPDGWKLADRLRAIVHDEDPTRPVTMGNNSPAAGRYLWQGVDLLGYNYKPDLYADFHRAHPDIPVFGSETASCVSSRGVYFFPVDWNKAKGFFDFQVSSYDLYAPPWAMRPDLEFAGQDRNRPWVLGEYVWTGFDYLGEPTPYNRDPTNLLNFHNPAERERAQRELERLGRVKCPSRSSYFGIVDLAGLPKDRFYLYQARWRPDLPIAHLLPHWTWPDRVGQVTPVHVYTSGDEAELFLNGRSLGRRQRGEFDYRLVWDDVKYQPGELRVVAYKGGRHWAEAVQRTAGKPAALQLSADRVSIRNDGRDLCYVTVEVLDANGVPAPTATPPLRFAVTGAAQFVAADNGDATDLTTFSEPARRAFSGKCVVILRGRKGAVGPATLTVTSPQLPPARIPIEVE